MSNPSPDANAKRRADLTPISIEEKAAKLEDLAAQLRGYSAAIKQLRIARLTVDGVMKFDRASALLGEFCANVGHATLKEKNKS